MNENVLNFSKEVGVVVNGPTKFSQASHVSESLQIVVDEQQFYKMTGMMASAPARVALVRLLKEDVTSKTLKKIWKDELVFDGSKFNVTVYRWAPQLFYALCAMFALSVVGAVLAINRIVPLSIGAVFLAMTIVSMPTLVIFVSEVYLPFVVAKRVQPMVERVNGDLPDLLGG